MKKTIFILTLALLSITTSCNDDNNVNQTATVSVTFDNRMSAAEDLILNNTTFINDNNETIVTSELKYIISNIRLTRDNGTVFEYPKDDSYFVINEADPTSLQLNLSAIPYGNYTHISFGIGVDQSKYPLDGGAMNFIPKAEEAGMLWNWAAGYKFVKFEGMYTPNGGTQNQFIIHVGSHGTTLDNYKTVTLPFASAINVGSGNTPTIQVTTLIENILDATHNIKLEDGSDIQVDPVNAPKIAKNMESAFQVQ